MFKFKIINTIQGNLSVEFSGETAKEEFFFSEILPNLFPHNAQIGTANGEAAISMGVNEWNSLASTINQVRILCNIWQPILPINQKEKENFKKTILSLWNKVISSRGNNDDSNKMTEFYNAAISLSNEELLCRGGCDPVLISSTPDAMSSSQKQAYIFARDSMGYWDGKKITTIPIATAKLIELKRQLRTPLSSALNKPGPLNEEQLKHITLISGHTPHGDIRQALYALVEKSANPLALAKAYIHLTKTGVVIETDGMQKLLTSNISEGDADSLRLLNNHYMLRDAPRRLRDAIFSNPAEIHSIISFINLLHGAQFPIRGVQDVIDRCIPTSKYYEALHTISEIDPKFLNIPLVQDTIRAADDYQFGNYRYRGDIARIRRWLIDDSLHADLVNGLLILKENGLVTNDALRELFYARAFNGASYCDMEIVAKCLVAFYRVQHPYFQNIENLESLIACITNKTEVNNFVHTVATVITCNNSQNKDMILRKICLCVQIDENPLPLAEVCALLSKKNVMITNNEIFQLEGFCKDPAFTKTLAFFDDSALQNGDFRNVIYDNYRDEGRIELIEKFFTLLRNVGMTVDETVNDIIQIFNPNKATTEYTLNSLYEAFVIFSENKTNGVSLLKNSSIRNVLLAEAGRAGEIANICNVLTTHGVTIDEQEVKSVSTYVNNYYFIITGRHHVNSPSSIFSYLFADNKALLADQDVRRFVYTHLCSVYYHSSRDYQDNNLYLRLASEIVAILREAQSQNKQVLNDIMRYIGEQCSLDYGNLFPKITAISSRIKNKDYSAFANDPDKFIEQYNKTKSPSTNSSHGTPTAQECASRYSSSSSTTSIQAASTGIPHLSTSQMTTFRVTSARPPRPLQPPPSPPAPQLQQQQQHVSSDATNAQHTSRPPVFMAIRTQ